MAFLAEAGGETEMIERGPLVGSSGRMFFHTLLEPWGLTRDDVILANVLKGHPPNNAYPIGDLRKQAEKHCRIHDSTQRIQLDGGVGIVEGGLDKFDPNLALVTVHPAFVSRTWSIMRVAREDIGKACRLVDKGYRVIVLLGNVAQNLVLPDLEGSLLKWRGHYQEINWGKLREGWSK